MSKCKGHTYTVRCIVANECTLINTVSGRNNLLFFFTEEEFKKYYRMPGWGKPLYEMKEAKIPEGAIPNAFDWRDKGALSCLKYYLVELCNVLFFHICNVL